jgi:hypothetical protein
MREQYVPFGHEFIKNRLEAPNLIVVSHDTD